METSRAFAAASFLVDHANRRRHNFLLIENCQWQFWVSPRIHWTNRRAYVRRSLPCRCHQSIAGSHASRIVVNRKVIASGHTRIVGFENICRWLPNRRSVNANSNIDRRMRQMRQRFTKLERSFRTKNVTIVLGSSHTPNDAVDKRRLSQCFYAKRDRQVTPSETGIMRQTRQRSSSQVSEIIEEKRSLPFVLEYLSTSFFGIE